MHDPLTVAFEIRRPWPQRTAPIGRDATRWRIRYSAFWRLAGRDYFWPALITVWHREPGSRDAGTVCRGRRTRRLHVHHWRLQIPPLQQLRRRLFTRCTWCGGPDRKGDAVNHSHQWNRARGHWWQGETGLFHRDCSGIQSAHRTCVCEQPVLDNDGYGRCARCNRTRAYGTTPERLERARELQRIPTGARTPAPPRA